MSNAESFINGILMPTPAAVLKAARVLAEGTDKEDGIGDLIVVDIGGATTDVHSLADGEPSKPGVTLRGLEEPFAKRTVEGDLGMRYSAISLWEASGTRKLQKYLCDNTVDVEACCKYRAEHIKMVPETEEEIKFDEAMAKVATDMAMERHVGVIESMYTPMGVIYSQIGKDLLNVKCVIGTGGVLVHSKNPGEILKAGSFDMADATHLKPQHPEYYIDKTYILSAMGLLAEDLPDKAVRIMKKYLVKV
ncbi:glutamate mutase, mutL [Clostridium tetanomorphum]|nr:glutamate mutase, mutL [Clostridium tetanomorphum]